jgi:hypothetical protein
MMDFMTWVLMQKDVVPDADRLVLLIRAAGPSGIPEGELRSAVDLPRKTVDDLLTALVQAGQIVIVDRQGKRFCVSR